MLVEEVKVLFCKFKCNAKNIPEVNCTKCDLYGNNICETDICKLCQIDNFINELKDYKLL